MFVLFAQCPLNPAAIFSPSVFLQINADFSFCQRLLSLNDKVVLPVERRSILARCWAPGSERSFRSYLMSWESAVVTDLSP